MRIILLIVTLSFLVGCTKESSAPGPAGTRGPDGQPGTGGASDTGSITGNISLYDEFSSLVGDASGAIVTLSSGSQVKNATADNSGQYTFYGITTGTYNMVFEKTGFGEMKIFGLTHIAGGTVSTKVKDIYLLGSITKTSVDSVYVEGDNFSFTTIGVVLDTSALLYTQYSQNFIVCVGKDATVDQNHYVVKLNSEFTGDGIGGYSNVINKDALRNISFQAGDTMYIRAYTYNRYVHPQGDKDNYIDKGDGGFYIDPSSGFYVYPNISNPSNLLKVAF